MKIAIVTVTLALGLGLSIGELLLLSDGSLPKASLGQGARGGKITPDNTG